MKKGRKTDSAKKYKVIIKGKKPRYTNSRTLAKKIFRKNNRGRTRKAFLVEQA